LTHLAYYVHKSGRKTTTFNLIIGQSLQKGVIGM
jgi:hypothetical protein